MANRQFKSALVSRNIYVEGRRTSIRLEPAFWQLLSQVSLRECVTLNEICTRISTRAFSHGLTGAIRVFLLAYAWSRSMERALAAVPSGQLPEISLDR
jgi:predicted DNA-binding ribbon-helix-helix protein